MPWQVPGFLTVHAALDGFWPRVRRVARPSVWLALACLGAGCEIQNTPISHEVGNLSHADRIEVTVEGRTPVATITDVQKVAAIAAFVNRYRDGWIDVWSGGGAQRYVAFYSGERILAQTGVNFRGITDGNYARPLTPAEVTELVDLLGIPWPPPENPTATPRRDRVP